MAEIRLSKLTKQFSIGLARLVDFLNEKGANVEMNPNAKISDEYLPAIEAKFGEDQKLKKDSEKVTIKLKEIIEMGSKKKPGREEEDAPEKEVVIKSNVLNTEPVKEVRPAEPEVKPAEKETPAPVPAPAPAPAAAANGEKIESPMPGSILKVNVANGQAVKQGDVLMILEAMKMENEIMAPIDGTIASLSVSQGSTVDSGSLLCVIQ